MVLHSHMRSAASEDEGRSRPSLRELEVLHAVIATRKTTAAAHRLGISQPAVSRAIGSLESRLGRELFLRDGGRLVPTADAFALDREAAQIFTALDRLDGWPDTIRTGSLLRVAAPPTIAQYFLAELIARFRIIEPNVRLQVEIGKSSDVSSAVADGTADLGFVDEPAAHPGIVAQTIRRCTAHAVLWPDHPLAEKPHIGASDLADVPLVFLTRRFSSRARLERAFANAGIQPVIVAEATTSAFVVEMVKRRVGVTIVNPFPLAFEPDPDLVFRPFRPTIPFETTYLMPSTGTGSPAAQQFADFVRANQPDDPYTHPLR